MVRIVMTKIILLFKTFIQFVHRSKLSKRPSRRWNSTRIRNHIILIHNRHLFPELGLFLHLDIQILSKYLPNYPLLLIL